jgi:hypothetical protein
MQHLQLRQALRRGEIDDVEVLQVKHLTPSDGKAYLAKWKACRAGRRQTRPVEISDDEPDDPELSAKNEKVQDLDGRAHVRM